MGLNYSFGSVVVSAASIREVIIKYNISNGKIESETIMKKNTSLGIGNGCKENLFHLFFNKRNLSKVFWVFLTGA